MSEEVSAIQYNKQCAHCGGDFITTVFEQLYCSPTHSRSARKKKQVARQRSAERNQRHNAIGMLKNKTCFTPGKRGYESISEALSEIHRLGDYSIAPYYCSCDKIHLGHHREASRDKFYSDYYLTNDFYKLSKSRVRTYALSKKADGSRLMYGSDKQNLVMSSLDADVVDKLRALMV